MSPQAPRDPSHQHRAHAHEHHRLPPVPWEPHQPENPLPYPRVVRDHEPGHQDDDHLHGKGEKNPEAVVPGEGNLGGARSLGEKGGYRGHVGEDDGEHERIRHPSLDSVRDDLTELLYGRKFGFSGASLGQGASSIWRLWSSTRPRAWAAAGNPATYRAGCAGNSKALARKPGQNHDGRTPVCHLIARESGRSRI